MKKLQIILGLFVTMATTAQTKEYVGKWELCKVVTPKGDTQRIEKSDARWMSYNFEYNNTFTSWAKEKDSEATGRWGFDFKDKYIKIKNPVYTITKKKIGDYNIVIKDVTPNWFIEKREEKKKEISYWIYCRVK